MGPALHPPSRCLSGLILGRERENYLSALRERHFVLDCVALTLIRVKYTDLFGPTIVPMQQFMWQDNLVRVAHFVFDCFASLQTLGGGQ